MDHLSKKKLTKVQTKVWRLSYALKGTGALFRENKQAIPLSDEELGGIGELLNILSDELAMLEDVLSYGHDCQGVGKDEL